ncbi:MAG: lamin tail domain-containing protein, partial [Verrucomicrobiota bacterium]
APDFQAVGSYLAQAYNIDTSFSGPAIRTALNTNAPTYYFRTTFNYTGNLGTTTLQINRWVDDGAVFYLNGVELHRDNMPAGAISFTTPALGEVTNPTLGVVNVPTAALVQGLNVFAVEVHHATGGSDALFGAELIATETPPDPAAPPDFALNEIAPATNLSFWVELVNQGTVPLNVNGYRLEVGGDPARGYTLTNNLLNPGAFILLDESELGFAVGDEEPLFLFRPGKTGLADARVVKNRLRGLHRHRWLYPRSPTPGATNDFTFEDAVVINEIMYHHQPEMTVNTYDESEEEWIEIYNRSTSTVNLAGWKIDGAVDFDFPSTASIAPDTYQVFVRDAAVFASNHPAVTVAGVYSGRLSDREERIELTDALGNPVDEVHYFDGGRWPESADGGGSSLELRDPFADNAVAEAWAASLEGSNAVWQTFTNRGVAAASTVGPDNQWREFVMGLISGGEILIDDLSVIEDPSGAAIQLIANGDFTGGSTDWRFRGNHRHSEVIPDPDNGANSVLRLVATGPTEHMHNQVETTLAGGQSVDNGTEYEVTFRARWVRGSRRLNT